MELGPPALGARSLNHWDTREVPIVFSSERDGILYLLSVYENQIRGRDKRGTGVANLVGDQGSPI